MSHEQKNKTHLMHMVAKQVIHNNKMIKKTVTKKAIKKFNQTV